MPSHPSQVELQNMWPFQDPPVETWFEMGRMTPHTKVSLLHVTKHMSGWRAYTPAHVAVTKYLSFTYNCKARQAGRPMMMAALRMHHGVED